jgi:hypothetical protein
MGAFCYSVFASSLRSNISIPGLIPSRAPIGDQDIALHLGIFPDLDLYTGAALSTKKLMYASPEIDESGESTLRVWELAQGALLHLVFSDGTQFWLNRKGSSIWATWSGKSSFENAISYVLGPILGIVLRLRGIVCLHASAVSLEGRCVAFVGAAGAGKSTAAAAFARSGYGIISDDIVGLVERDQRFYVLPAYPHVCLWPESVAMLYGSVDALPRFLHDWEKRRLTLGEGGTRFESRTLPLDAVYLLEERRACAAAEVSTIPDGEALLSLVANTYATQLINRTMRGQEFAVLGRLVSTVPVRMVHLSNIPRLIEDLCYIIRPGFETQNA